MIIPLLTLISLINNLSQKLQISSGGRMMVYIFGIIGVSVHEFSHYLFCKIFNHKVTDVKFFKPNWETGVMGYVHHTYNMHSLYQSIGQVFISVAPMIVGSSLIILLSKVFGVSSIGLKSIIENPILVVKYITFIYIFICISSHMICSFQDFKNCFIGIICIFVCIVICIFLFPGMFVAIYNGLLFILKLVLINLALSFLMFLVLSGARKE